MWVAFEIHWAIVMPNIRNPVHSLIKVTTETGSVINVRHIAIGCLYIFLRQRLINREEGPFTCESGP